MQGRALLRTQAASAALSVCVDARTGRLTDGYGRAVVRDIEYFDPWTGWSQGEMPLIPGSESRQFASGFRSATLDRSP